MAGSKGFVFLAIAALLLSTIVLIGVDGGPTEVTGEIQVQAEYLVILREDETLTYDVEGFFAVTGRTGFESIGTISATLSVSEGGWGPVLSQTRWDSVSQNDNYLFEISLTIPNGTGIGEQGTYTLILTFINSLDQEVGSDSSGFSVRVEEIIPNGDDDDASSDDDEIIAVEDDSFPLWPFFLVGIVIGLVIIGIWARKNLEMVREEDGSRRIMLREKDSGHILGRKKQPPPELDL